MLTHKVPKLPVSNPLNLFLLLGNDSWNGNSPVIDGSSNGPVQTLERALILSRNSSSSLRQISVAAGYYTLASTLQLTSVDSNLEIIAQVSFSFLPLPTL